MTRAVAESNQEDVQRWTTKLKAALVLSILKGKAGIQIAADATRKRTAIYRAPLPARGSSLTQYTATHDLLHYCLHEKAHRASRIMPS